MAWIFRIYCGVIIMHGLQRKASWSGRWLVVRMVKTGPQRVLSYPVFGRRGVNHSNSGCHLNERRKTYEFPVISYAGEHGTRWVGHSGDKICLYASIIAAELTYSVTYPPKDTHDPRASARNGTHLDIISIYQTCHSDNVHLSATCQPSPKTDILSRQQRNFPRRVEALSAAEMLFQQRYWRPGDRHGCCSPRELQAPPRRSSTQAPAAPSPRPPFFGTGSALGPSSWCPREAIIRLPRQRHRALRDSALSVLRRSIRGPTNPGATSPATGPSIGSCVPLPWGIDYAAPAVGSSDPWPKFSDCRLFSATVVESLPRTLKPKLQSRQIATVPQRAFSITVGCTR